MYRRKVLRMYLSITPDQPVFCLHHFQIKSIGIASNEKTQNFCVFSLEAIPMHTQNKFFVDVVHDV